METKLDELYRRIEKGISWLTEHDPKGRFYLWWNAKITPATPMPAQDEASREQYREWYSAMLTFERLWKEMEREERRSAMSG